MQVKSIARHLLRVATVILCLYLADSPYGGDIKSVAIYITVFVWYITTRADVEEELEAHRGIGMTLTDNILLGGEVEREVRRFCKVHNNNPEDIGRALLMALRMAEDMRNREDETNI